MRKIISFILLTFLFQTSIPFPAFAKTDLRIFVQNGDYASVEKAIKDGADVNYQGEDDPEARYEDVTPIIIAVYNNRYDLADLLLRNGANPNVYYSKGINPLIDAVLHNNLDMVKLLIKYKADPDQIDGYGQTALIFASKGGNLEIAKFLVESGANITHQDHTELTAHDYARMYKHDDVGDYFVEQLLYLG